jgi:hypothetical protein
MTSSGIKVLPAARAWAQAVTDAKTAGREESLAEGRTEGETALLLRLAAKRGIELDDETRDRVLACTDQATIDAWSDRLLTGRTAAEIFGD